MNDDFLHRIRKAPPPEFLAKLKHRLDRQPVPPPPPPRWSFLRGLVVGSLLGGTAFAITAVSLNRIPPSLRALAGAPTEFLARLIPGARDSDRSEKPDHHGAVPLGPAWIPTRIGSGQTGQVQTAPVSLDTHRRASGASGASGAPENSAASGAGSASGAQATPASPTLETFTIVAEPEVFRLAKSVAAHIQLSAGQINVELQRRQNFRTSVRDPSVFEPSGRIRTEVRSGISPWRLCLEPRISPEVIEVSRRLPPDMFSLCRRDSVIELKIGYQAVMLARAKLYGPLRLSSRDVFLALTSRFPDPSHSGGLIDNPIVTWSQLQPGLPNELIQVLGPAPTSGPGQLAQDLLLTPGCDIDPRMAAVRDTRPVEYDQICRTFRGEGVYITSSSAGSTAFVDQVLTNPTTVGIVSLAELDFAGDRLTPISIDGVEPTAANIANGTYPASRTLYLYANRYLVERSRLFSTVVRASMAPNSPHDNDPAEWAFVPLDDAERASTLDKLKDLHF